MNILFLSELIAYSGVGQYMIQIANELTKCSEVGTVVLASSNILRTDIPPSIVVEPVGGVDNILKYVSSIRSISLKYDITVVHCNHRKQAFAMRIYQMLYGKIAVVWTCHTAPYPNNWKKRILGYYGHKAIAISSEVKEWMHKELKIDETHLDLILNGVDNTSLTIPKTPKNILKEDFFKRKFNVQIDGKHTKVIITHGRLDPVKGLDLLIKSFSKLKIEELKNLKVVMSGNTDTPYYDELQRLINNYGVGNNFFFVGWINPADILSIADLMIQPSRREGFLLAAIEAFFMKVPVIRTKVGGYQDMKKYCIGIPTDDTDAITFAIREWIKEPSRLEGMVERAYKFAMTNCTIQIMTNKTVNTYKSAIKCCR